MIWDVVEDSRKDEVVLEFVDGWCAGDEDLTGDVDVDDGVMEGSDFSEDVSNYEA